MVNHSLAAIAIFSPHICFTIAWDISIARFARLRLVVYISVCVLLIKRTARSTQILRCSFSIWVPGIVVSSWLLNYSGCCVVECLSCRNFENVFIEMYSNTLLKVFVFIS